jgi:hypothetical protein
LSPILNATQTTAADITVATETTAGSEDVQQTGDKDDKAATSLETLQHKMCGGALPTPPDVARANPMLDAVESTDAKTETTQEENDNTNVRKRKTTTSTQTTDRAANKSTTTTRKRRAHSSASAENTSSASRKKAKPAPIEVKEDASTAKPPLPPVEHREPAQPRPTQRPTIFERLTEASIDWCRYCGTTEGVNWRPGPWGKRTLCNKHGCDYKGYGFACKLPRLNLTAYQRESIHERERPVLQLFCTVCHSNESWCGDVLVSCEGCPKAYHQRCYPGGLTDEQISAEAGVWYCTKSCAENGQKRRIIVDLPRKRLPLMRSPKDDDANSDADSTTSTRRGSSASPSEDGGSPRTRNFPSTTSSSGRGRSSSTSATNQTTTSCRRTARSRRRPFYGETDANEDEADTTVSRPTRTNTSSTCRSLLTEQFRFTDDSYRRPSAVERYLKEEEEEEEDDENNDDEDDDMDEDVAAAQVSDDEDEDMQSSYTQRYGRSLRVESDEEMDDEEEDEDEDEDDGSSMYWP